MAQEANGLPYQSSNPSGVGAVYFDKTIDPLAVHLQNLEGADKAYYQLQKQREAKKANAAKFIADLNPDLNGIMDSDTPYFQQQSKDLFDIAKKAVSMGGDITNPSHPMYWDVQSKLANINAEIQASKNQKQNVLAATKTYMDNPDKYEQQPFEAALAKYRLMGSPSLRAQHDLSDAFQRVKPDVIKGLIEDYKNIPLSENYKGEIKLGERVGSQFEKGHTAEQQQALAMSNYNNPAKRESWKLLYEQLSPAERVPFQIKAAAETADNHKQGIDNNGDPLKYFIQETSQRLDPRSKEVKDIAYPPYLAKLYERNWNAEDAADAVPWQGIYRAIKGDPSAFDSKIGGSGDNYFGVQSGNDLWGAKNVKDAQISTLGAGNKIGTFLAYKPVMTKDMMGNPVQATNADGSLAYTTQAAPNIHYAIKYEDGKPYAMTSQSVYNAALKEGKNPDNMRPEELYELKGAWQPIDKNYVRSFEQGQSAKETMAKRKSHNEYLQGVSAIDRGIVDLDKAAGVKPVKQEVTVKTKQYTPELKTKAAQVLKTNGYPNDDNAVNTFLSNNPNFK